eukprot:TRINITY_DN4796_c0_g1_i4.p2 TRINITY_DN4796_c0_g1~~TRINITY_DN4796_c0_g1_i4.p2  ORF type:complete len:207 (+),score=-6.74 TRINITY_DN4796_c0_g1_i4:307-927(+)
MLLRASVLSSCIQFLQKNVNNSHTNINFSFTICFIKWKKNWFEKKTLNVVENFNQIGLQNGKRIGSKRKLQMWWRILTKQVYKMEKELVRKENFECGGEFQLNRSIKWKKNWFEKKTLNVVEHFNQIGLQTEFKKIRFTNANCCVCIYQHDRIFMCRPYFCVKIYVSSLFFVFIYSGFILIYCYVEQFFNQQMQLFGVNEYDENKL